jgi:hypothetical protein
MKRNSWYKEKKSLRQRFMESYRKESSHGTHLRSLRRHPIQNAA